MDDHVIMMGIERAYRKALVIIFSLGKMIASTGQTIFTVRHAGIYIFRGHAPFSMDVLSLCVAACTLFVVCITRVPAINRQLSCHPKEVGTVIQPFSSFWQISLYYLLVICNDIAGLFSSVGAYLGTLVLLEWIAKLTHTEISAVLTQRFGLVVALSAFVAYYSFNIYKAKLNAYKLTYLLKYKRVLRFLDKNFLKAMGISFLNVASAPFIAYFLTKNSLVKMSFLSQFLSAHAIQSLALLSAFSALIASVTTTVPALLGYLNETEAETEPLPLMLLRYTTYLAGLFDSAAFGMGNFIGFILVSRDIFHFALYNPYIILIAIGCAISAMCLNLVFSIRQGFNDFARGARPQPRLNVATELVRS